MRNRSRRKSLKYRRARGDTPEEEETKQSSSMMCKRLSEEQCNLQSSCQYIKGTTKRRGYCRRRATPTAKRNTTKKTAKKTRGPPKGSPKDDTKGSLIANINASITFPDGQVIELTGIHATASVLQLKHRISQETSYPVSKIMLFNIEDKRDDDQDLQFRNNVIVSEIATTGSLDPVNLKLAVIVNSDINIAEWLSQFPEEMHPTKTLGKYFGSKWRSSEIQQEAHIANCRYITIVPKFPNLVVCSIGTYDEVRVYDTNIGVMLCRMKIYEKLGKTVSRAKTKEPYIRDITISNDSKHIYLLNHDGIYTLLLDINDIGTKADITFIRTEDNKTKTTFPVHECGWGAKPEETKSVHYPLRDCNLLCRQNIDNIETLIVVDTFLDQCKLLELTLDLKIIRYIANPDSSSYIGRAKSIAILPNSKNIVVGLPNQYRNSRSIEVWKPGRCFIIDYKTGKVIHIIKQSACCVATDANDNIIISDYDKATKLNTIYVFDGNYQLLISKVLDNVKATDIVWSEEDGGQLIVATGTQNKLVIFQSE